MFFGPSTNSLFQLSGPNNPPNNFFGSQINIGDPNNVNVCQLDTSGTFVTRNANAFTGQNIFARRQGWDITNIYCSTTMNNNQSSALVRITTNQDVYAINGVGLTIETILIEGTKGVNSDVVNVGDSLVYTATLTNQGGVTTSNVGFKDTTPNGTTYVGPLTVSTNYSGVNVQDGITISIIAPGEDVTIQWTVLVNTTPNPNPILNVGRILVTSLPETQTNTVSTRVNTADLSIVKSATPSPGIPGDTLLYSLVVTNNGPDTSYLVRVIDTIPDNIIAASTRYSIDNGTTWLPWLGFYDVASLAQN